MNLLQKTWNGLRVGEGKKEEDKDLDQIGLFRERETERGGGKREKQLLSRCVVMIVMSLNRKRGEKG